MKPAVLLPAIAIAVLASTSSADEFSYSSVAKRYPANALSAEQVLGSKMQGECLVGLKNLNFKKKETFDPVAEWGNYRSLSLLEQFPPCEVLIIMEVAQGKLKAMQSN